jgi:hypothetical protein
VTLEDGRQTLSEDLFVDEILEQLLAVQHDNRDALEIGSMERLLGGDVELVELERKLGPHTEKRGASLDAEMAVGLGIEGYDSHSKLRRG